MGLAQAKKRVKLSHDPNNTSWSNNTSSFGHKILTSQGWTPGEYLGAKDAAHAEFHGAANASHIRVVLKDDNLGLGAKKGSGQGPGECTGLDAFTSLLGRLNADDQEEYVQEEKKRGDLKRAIYTEQKWGSMRFVKGGFLVGDKVVEIAEAEAERVRNLENKAGTGSSEASEGTGSSTEEDAEDKEMVSKRKKSRKQADDTEAESAKEKSKKEKKRKNKEKAESGTTEETEAERRIRKKEKKEKKRKAEEEASASSSKKRKDDSASVTKPKKRRRQESTPDESQHPTEKSSRKNKDKKAKTSSKDTTPETIEKEAPIPNPPRPTILQGRHAVRARNIAQKRMASMDAASLNQIFMVKG